MDSRIQLIRNIFDTYRAPFFTRGLYNVNLFGVRAKHRNRNEFNDVIGLAFKTEAGWYSCAFPATTDPGKTVLGSKMGNGEGTALLPPSTLEGAGRYRFRLGTHRGYTALVQAHPFTIVRDSDQDGLLLSRDDVAAKVAAGEVVTGWYGINLHRSTETGAARQVNDWSWGCQVIQHAHDWAKLLEIIRNSANRYGSTFTYTLFTEEDVEQALGCSLNSFYKLLNDNRSI